MKISPAK